jgi:hypothetical protein
MLLVIRMYLGGNFENEIPESDSGTTISGFADSKKKKIMLFLNFYMLRVSPDI